MEDKEVVPGRNPVLEYLKSTNSGDKIELYISDSAHGKIIDDIKSAAMKKGIKPEYRDKTFFAKYESSSKHQGVILVRPRMKSSAVTAPSLIERTYSEKGLIVLLDHITDPHNTGSIIRSAEALGASGVVIPRSNSSGINETVIKTSAGATAHIDIVTVANSAQFLDLARENNLWVIGTSDRAEKELSELEDLLPAVLVIGSEGEGIKRLVEEKCDFLVKIPLKGKISSLNASVAAGIAIYELLKK